MKQLLYSICIGSVALALCAPGAMAKDKNKERKAKSAHVAAAPGQARAAVRSHGQRGAQQSLARSHGQRGAQQSLARSHGQRGAQQSLAHRRNVMRPAQSRAIVNRRSVQSDRGQTVRQLNTANRSQARQRNFARSEELATRRAVRGTNSVAVNREQNNFRANRTREINRSGRVSITNNWRGDRFSGERYAAFRNYSRHWHNRDWYRHNYNQIIFVSGGWWYWNSGYWYPAWGYAPNAYYSYDGPIYTGYAHLTPHEIVVNAQVQLQRDGYYSGPIDGLLGPMTRRALAAFQFDHGLAVTSTLDQPTASMLGVA